MTKFFASLAVAAVAVAAPAQTYTPGTIIPASGTVVGGTVMAPTAMTPGVVYGQPTTVTTGGTVYTTQPYLGTTMSQPYSTNNMPYYSQPYTTNNMPYASQPSRVTPYGSYSTYNGGTYSPVTTYGTGTNMGYRTTANGGLINTQNGLAYGVVTAPVTIVRGVGRRVVGVFR